MDAEGHLSARGNLERVTPLDDQRREALRKDGPVKYPTAVIPKLVFPSSLRGKPIPQMEWIVDQWIPRGEVTLLYGDGGVGKTLLAQQLMACSALGKPWCSLPVHRCRSIGIFCEDDDAELHRRQDAIQRHLQIDFGNADIDAMTWWSRKGEDNLLATFDYEGKIKTTPLYDAIGTAAKDHRADLIILDTVADLFGGNEIDRGQVRRFMGLLARMAIACTASVVLCAHPSRAGMSSGTMDSGSTGWSNSARSRLALARPNKEGDQDVDPDERILAKMKSNRSSIGDRVKLRWQDGVIASGRPAAFAPSTVLAGALSADDVFLDLLAQVGKEGRPVSASTRAGNYAPKAFSKNASRQGFGKQAFEEAMERLFAANRISTEEYGKANGDGVRPRRIIAVPRGEDA